MNLEWDRLEMELNSKCSEIMAKWTLTKALATLGSSEAKRYLTVNEAEVLLKCTAGLFSQRDKGFYFKGKA